MRACRPWMKVALFALLIAQGCERDKRPKVVIPLGDERLTGLKADDADVLLRYLRTSPRWEVREDQGRTVAFRRERNGGVGDEAALMGGFRTSLNGFYGDFRARELVQTRVAVWFDEPPEQGRLGGPDVTVADVQEAEVTLRPAVSSPGEARFTTWLRVKTEAGLTVEVMEEARAPERRFTRSALAQVAQEFSRALSEREALLRDGHVPALWSDERPTTGAPSMTVTDGMQPGIYVVTAWANPHEDGEVFVRVRQAGLLPVAGAALKEVTAGQVLSAERMRGRTTRRMGFSATQPESSSPTSRSSPSTRATGRRTTARGSSWSSSLRARAAPSGCWSPTSASSMDGCGSPVASGAAGRAVLAAHVLRGEL